MKKLRYLSILLTLSLLQGMLSTVSYADALSESDFSETEEYFLEEDGDGPDEGVLSEEELTEFLTEENAGAYAEYEDASEETYEEYTSEEIYDTSMGAFVAADDREGYRADYVPSEYSVSEDASIPEDGSRPAGFNENEWKVLKLINTQRGKKGKEPLAGFAALQSVADVRTEEIKTKFSHTRPDGSSCFTAFTVPCWGAGENIAMGFTSASSVMDAWMHSSGHKKNIMYDDFTHVGVGQSGRYWVQCFIGSMDTSCSISVNAPQRILKKGKKISSLEIVVKLEDENGVSYLPLNDYMCSGCNTKKNGVYNVTVTVRGATATFPLIVCSNGKSITVDDIDPLDPETTAPSAIFSTGQKLTLSNFAADANEIAKYKITTGTKKASISSTGKFSAKKAGNVIVTAYKKDGCIYYATERYLFRIEKPKFTKKTLKVKTESETDMNLYLTGLSNLHVDSWESSKPEVAAIDPATGKLTALSKGTTTVRAVFDNGETVVKKTIKVKVK